jgi:hypothetical protein
MSTHLGCAAKFAAPAVQRPHCTQRRWLTVGLQLRYQRTCNTAIASQSNNLRYNYSLLSGGLKIPFVPII